MMLRGMWGTFRKLVDEFTANKVIMYGTDYKTKLPEFIQVDQLEQKFGGILPDKESNFFPPDFGGDEEKLITLQEYKEAVEKKKE